jgi:hypothetical protein
MSMIIHYGADGDSEAFVPAPAEDPAPLAQAVDAAIDAVGDALDQGNVAQAQALLTAADAASDALLDALGVTDADDPDVG